MPNHHQRNRPPPYKSQLEPTTLPHSPSPKLKFSQRKTLTNPLARSHHNEEKTLPPAPTTNTVKAKPPDIIHEVQSYPSVSNTSMNTSNTSNSKLPGQTAEKAAFLEGLALLNNYSNMWSSLRTTVRFIQFNIINQRNGNGQIEGILPSI